MKRLLLIFCFAMLASLANAQKIYFIYLQTEKREPFFVRMNDKIFNSTASGYLILSKLIDSTYNFKLGFPGKDLDLHFAATIDNKDHGYLIKDFGGKGWGLFDLQSLTVQMSSTGTKASGSFNNDSNSPVNAFTELLAQATGDPSLKQNAVYVKEEERKQTPIETVRKEEKEPEVTQTVVKEQKKSVAVVQPINKPEDSRTGLNEEKLTPVSKDSVTKRAPVYKRSKVTHLSGVATVEGFESVFVDEYQNGARDTIRIVVPPQNQGVIAKDTSDIVTSKPNKKFLDIPDDTAQAIREPEKNDESKNQQSIDQDRNENSKNPDLKTRKDETRGFRLFTKNKSEATATQNCQEVADNNDFLKLRRKMAGRTSDDGMLDEAKKYFKTKCFTTDQIKNLSSMFLSNAGKFNFFNIAYDYASDKENFPSLQSELKDEFYINQFRAMLRN